MRTSRAKARHAETRDYPPGGEPVCTRLAQQLEVPVQPLPGGTDSRRCVVIVGPERGPGN